MRLFQNSGLYRAYRPRLVRLTRDCLTFDQAIAAFLDDRFGAPHFLKPVLDRSPDAFFANGDDERSQRFWAAEHGLPAKSRMADILLAQIEAHRTEIFYNLDPMRYGDDFLARLPGCVRKTIAWRAAPSDGGQFLKYDLVVNNFPSLLSDYRSRGARVAYFYPAHDPAMDEYASRDMRGTDILFVGTYSRHHRKRAAMLEAVAKLRIDAKIVMHLDRSRLVRVAETPMGWLGPLKRHRRPSDVLQVAREPVFGRDLLNALGRAKIVVNGAIDMSLEDRGNMRVWEALGCRTALLSDAGRYPAHLQAGTHFESYDDMDDLLVKIAKLLRDSDKRSAIADAGFEAISRHYSKTRQWAAFQQLAS